MRIAQVAPLYETVPPERYGGTERVIAALSQALSASGHEVVLFAAGGSTTAVDLVACSPGPLRERMSRTEMIELAPHVHLAMLAEVYRHGDEFDVIHAHTDVWTLPFTEFTSTPTVMTMHGRLDLPTVRALLPEHPEVPLVSISDSQRTAVADLPLNWAATVYNGLALDSYATPVVGEDYLLFVGRLTAEKRPDWAVEIAERTGLPLRVGAKVDPLDAEYFTDEIEPLFRAHRVEFLGEVQERDKPALFGAARATLMPIDWPEPFGLVMIESLAAGTPVIALNRGSVPEIIEHGVSGFVCESVDEMVEAVALAGHLDPAACRRRARCFSAERMANGYLDVYERLVGRRREPLGRLVPTG